MRRRVFIRALAAGAAAAGPLRRVSARTAVGDTFDEHLAGDVWLAPADRPLAARTLARLARVQRTVGHGNFQTLGFDGALKIARGYQAVGRFERAELEFVERLFHADAARYGFMGEKVARTLTEPVPGRLVRPAGARQRLVRGHAQARFDEMRAVAGDDLVLTSGVRSVVKQTHLFLAKLARSDGNLSRASRSLAPPGYSYHGIGDFDVGQRGLGSDNFTDRFAGTRLYRRLVEAGYLIERYPRGNLIGVRHEPWHVMVVERVG